MILLLFDDIINNPLLNDLNPLSKNNEYFVTRSCKDFIEMQDHGAFWTTARDHVSIIQITENRNRYHRKKLYEIEEKEKKVDVNLSCQIPIFTTIYDERYKYNILDVTITNDWTPKFGRKYGIKYNHRALMVLYTEIRQDISTTWLYAIYSCTIWQS